MHRPLLLVVLALGLAAGACGGPAAPERVFLITIDTLRADHLGLYGYPRGTSPFLDALGSEALVFETAYSSSSHTAPSHASLFTSLHPAQHRLLRNGEELHEALLTLPQVFREQGYRTAAFTTVRFLYGLRQGFDEFHCGNRVSKASDILGPAREWIRQRPAGEKLFVWIHLFDVHEWDQPESLDWKALNDIGAERRREDEAGMAEFLRREHGTLFYLGEETILQAVAQYDGQILSVDRALGSFFESMESEGLAGDALWIVASDHGEGLGNHNYMNHGANIYNEQIHVPLIFYFSDRRFAPRRIEGLVRLVDVAPTLAELVGASFESQVIPSAGRSFLSELESDSSLGNVRAVFAQRRPADEKRLGQGWAPGEIFGVLTERYKVIGHSEGRHEVYDLATDPFELHNLIDALPAENERLLEGLERHFSEMMAQGEKLGVREINPEYVEELKALGYL